MILPALGTPYAFPSDPPRSYDCWTLMTYLRAQIGLWTPPVDACWAPETIAEAIAKERERWEQVAEPSVGDAVLMNDEHIGVYLGVSIAHATLSTGVLYTPVRAARRRFPGMRHFRPCQ